MGASSGILTINGRDIDDLNLTILDLGSPYGGLSYNRAAPQTYGSAGAWPAAEATVAPRVITFELALDATVSNRRSRLDAVRRHLQGMLEIVLEDESTRIIHGRVESAPGEPRFPSVGWVDATADLSLTIDVTCFNPYWQDLQARVVSFGSTRTETPLGSGVTPPVVIIQGPATDPKLTYRGITGAELASIVFDKTLASDQVLEIDMRTQRVVLEDFGAGTRTKATGAISSGWFFNLDPGDGDRDGSAWPTLEVDAGEGECHYRRYWE